MNEIKYLVENPDDDLFCVDYDDNDFTKIHIVIRGPDDSLYKYKFLRFEVTFPEQFPISPPHFKFIQYGGYRIHPNLYVDRR